MSHFAGGWGTRHQASARVAALERWAGSESRERPELRNGHCCGAGVCLWEVAPGPVFPEWVRTSPHWRARRQASRCLQPFYVRGRLGATGGFPSHRGAEDSSGSSALYTEKVEISCSLASKEDDTGAEGHGPAQTGGWTDDGWGMGECMDGQTDGWKDGDGRTGRRRYGGVHASLDGRTSRRVGERTEGE